ncbi:MAG TPA: class I SAM-dependent methyltransferase [Ignavibacteriaceae bacterium]|nr:class I SAM-dependent methyltransferase [Ignavibacteriaceae bacterium]
MNLLKVNFSELRCPRCLDHLVKAENSLSCKNSNCLKIYPIVNDIPILINEEHSVFLIKDFLDNKETTFNLSKNTLEKIAKKIVPSISNNIKAKTNYKKLLSLLLSRTPNPKVLVVGGSILGEGIEDLITSPQINLIESDVTFGPRTQIIFDAHNIPFPNEFFDCVIIQAVLEHVIDPQRCVKEVHRVLNKHGLVYAETPFMQQVHMGRYDFQRFTHLGHRRLFREFNEIESGAVCGTGMALAWAYSHFLFSFFSSKRVRKLLVPFTRITSFFWKYFDYILINKPGTLDAASGYFFMGKKAEIPLDDRDLLKLYKGLL